jgi:hypothetical protein
MIAAVNHSDICQMTKSRCPQSVKTRWLSRNEALIWLLSREEMLLTMNFKTIPKSRWSQIRAIITKNNFASLSLYHRLIYPFTQAVKFFEEDRVTLCYVYPTLKNLKKHFREEADSHSESNPEYAAYCASILPIIQQRQSKLLDRDLLKAAFWLTSFGCRSLATDTLFIPIGYRLDIKYQAPFPIRFVPGGINGFMKIINFPPPREEQEQDETDYSYTGEEILEDELEEVPKTRGYRNQVLTFLTEFLSNLILEDLDRESQENVFPEVHHQVEESLQFFFCNPESIAKCRCSLGFIDMEVELWNWMKYKSERRISDQFAQKVISIVSIPAYEGSCERSLSRQKRILDHLRKRSNQELLRARFLFESSNN